MVAQILWLGMKDVFVRIAKDVVGQGFDRGTSVLTLSSCYFSIVLKGDEEFWFRLLLRSLRALIHNQCGVSCGMIACSDVTERTKGRSQRNAGLKKKRDLLDRNAKR
ncbi:hypothetical protein F2Q68_00040192 [Brassica cretica]|uniref:Uncharacterized protein n=1 Tax=Brassica cretica TaxID=69181 RepID=A0A8S9MLG7_BRACR|nr:hypothetical protein F2Q68_00040192 [Brassica cretica]